ncbi:Enhancer of polycomb-like protein [Forsythia ovata]|uniref:Enhancer of polycomb-like protein n=1 Tax=Forsythia ovata TaxID=205694 RepID=A0ABD1TMK1_9LAMI
MAKILWVNSSLNRRDEKDHDKHNAKLPHTLYGFPLALEYAPLMLNDYMTRAEMTTTLTKYRSIIEMQISNARQAPRGEVASEITTPKFVVMDTYERDYSCTFAQLRSYLHAGRGETITLAAE